mmetsp:Transcript_59878/g.147135  ORF Transcript_59878/g.147135 Transcript_59878/m.147135 type:complete len:371 (-) Transcript_59878:446-1558(-)
MSTNWTSKDNKMNESRDIPRRLSEEVDETSLIDMFETNKNPPSFERLPFRPIATAAGGGGGSGGACSTSTTSSTTTAASSTTIEDGADDASMMIVSTGSKYDADDERTTQPDSKDNGRFMSSWSSRDIQEIGQWIETQVSPATDTHDNNSPRPGGTPISWEYTKAWDPNIKYSWYIVAQPDSTFYLKVNGEGSFLILESDEIIDSIRSVKEDHDDLNDEELHFLIYLTTSRMYMMVEKAHIESVLKDIIQCSNISKPSSPKSSPPSSSTSSSTQERSSKPAMCNYFRSHSFRGASDRSRNQSAFSKRTNSIASSPGIKFHLGLGSAWKFVKQQQRRRRVHHNSNSNNENVNNNSYRRTSSYSSNKTNEKK